MSLKLFRLTKEFPQKRVLRGISCEITGKIVAILGPNGAGKSTLLKILATIYRPSSGYFSFQNLDSRTKLQELRKITGFVGHKSLLYPTLTLRENAELFAQLYSFKKPKKRISELAELLKLTNRLEQPVGEFSRGLLQRASLLRALIHSPKLLILDEPFTGLDSPSSQILAELVQEQKESRLTLLTTHNFQWASQLADQYIFLENGRISQTFSEKLTPQKIEQIFQNLKSS